ncbi:UDP-3-O-(3-hydroxymyristoyl)glucosamine N-acyltransferase [Kiritimatiella glycovorans]|uniref:UDP-3-O-acylglucosamine N-acyltransferase n=1 Tax=Kiritimatiella glycovorans TaxID=1307763 RepID=A0A0G3EG93_9BACT|nr:UDP-3-O-(3-hydroxymyristoyl)glucosamine N-acyltransferase [Kiritimatiella glycovorans]AKJ64427.1 UDP-3-O-acylglucosamine N-acyltransferase [Kiritimatiella glycovorans]
MKIEEIASLIGAEIDGDGSREITGVAGVREAGPRDITFIANKRYAADAETTKAGAVVVGSDWTRTCPATLLRTENPDAAFARVARRFRPELPKPEPGIHPTATVARDAELGEDVHIGPGAVIDPEARVGDRTVVGAQSYIGFRSSVGEDCLIYPQVVIRECVTAGDRVILHSGVVLGCDGFGYAVQEDGSRTKIPQIGRVVIGDDVEIGSNTTVDRARFGVTRIGNGVKIDNLVQIAHNVVIEDHAVIVAQVGISGSSHIGSRAILAGQVGVAGHLRIGEDAIIGAQSGVSKDIDAGAFVFGSPAAPMEKVSRVRALVNRLPNLKSKIEDLEKRLEAMERKGS